MKHNKGFTLLETVVALSLMAVVGGMLLAWLNTNIMAITRIEAAEFRIDMIKSAREFIALKNPMVEPQGEVRIDDFQLKWSSTPLTEELTTVRNSSGQYGIFKVQLFKTTVMIASDKLPEYTFLIEQLGYRQFRDPAGTL